MLPDLVENIRLGVTTEVVGRSGRFVYGASLAPPLGPLGKRAFLARRRSG